jgi:hypothetical protein
MTFSNSVQLANYINTIKQPSYNKLKQLIFDPIFIDTLKIRDIFYYKLLYTLFKQKYGFSLFYRYYKEHIPFIYSTFNICRYGYVDDIKCLIKSNLSIHPCIILNRYDISFEYYINYIKTIYTYINTLPLPIQLIDMVIKNINTKYNINIFKEFIFHNQNLIKNKRKVLLQNILFFKVSYD